MVSKMDMLLRLGQQLNEAEKKATILGLGNPMLGAQVMLTRKIGQPLIDNIAGKAATGGLEALYGRAMLTPLIRGKLSEEQQRANMEGTVFGQALTGYEQASGNPFERARAANEAGAANHEREQGIYNMALDPTNFLGPVSKGLEATKLAGLGRALGIMNDVPNLPASAAGKAVGKGVAKVANTEAGRQAVDAIERRVSGPLAGTLRRLAGIEIPPPLPPLADVGPPMPNERGDVPFMQLIKGLGGDGGRGLGPTLPPELGPTLDNLPPELGPQLPTRGNVPFDQMIPGIGKGGRGIGPVLPPSQDVPLPPELGPAFPSKGNARGFIGPILHPEQGPMLPPELGPELPTRGNVDPSQLIPGVGRNGGKGLGPERPIGPYLPLGAKSLPTPITMPPGAVTRAEERAARAVPDLIDNAAPTTSIDFPQLSGTREEALAQLSSDEVNRLVALAYPGETAQANALLAHPNPVELANAALERITRDNHALATLARTDDALARKLAYLPEPGAEAIQALPDAPGATADTYPAFLNLIRSVTGDLPLPTSDFYPKKLGVAAGDVPALFKQAADEGIIGELPMDPGRFAVKPSAAPLLQNTPVSAISRPATADNAIPAVDIPATVEASPLGGGAQPWEMTPAQYFEAQYLAGVKRRDYDNELTPELLDKHRQVVANAVDWLDKRAGLRAAPPSYASDLNPHYNPGEQILRRDDVYRPGSMASGIFPGEIRSIYEAHRNAVAEAIAAGKPVPEQVLAYYRDLAPKALAATDTAATIARGAAAKADLFGDAADVAPKRLPGGDIAAGGGGGGGLGLLPYPGGLNGAIGRAVLPAAAGGLTGAAGGAAIGAATTPDDRVGGALKGGLIGAGVGYAAGGGAAMAGLDDAVRQALPRHVSGSMLDPGMYTDAARAFMQGMADAHAAAPVGGNLPARIANQWRANMVMTLKQIPQDALTRAFVMWGIASREFGATGADLRRWQQGLRQERAAGVSMLDNPVTRGLRALGLQNRLADLGETYGVDFARTQAAGQELGGMGRALAGAGFSMASPAAAVNPIAPVIGAVRGYYQPGINAFVGFLNGIQHDAFRFALAERALNRDVPHLANDFLSELARVGHNVRPLEGRGGFFSPAEVAAVAGAQAGRDWAGLTEALVQGHGDRIAFLGGDFRRGSETAIERNIGRVAPFSRWGIRYAPVLAEIAIRHPRAALIAGRELQREGAEAKAQGKKAYQAGVTFDDKTPLLGPLARLRNGGAAGSTTLDPIGALMPYGDLLSGGDELPTDATPYQKVVNLLGRVGFSPNPAVQAGAYIIGQDYRTPGNLSRTAGLESGVEAIPAGLRLAGLPVPDLPQLPSGRNLLDAGRNLLEPVTGEKAVAATDPVMRRYAELVMAQTGKPLNDKSNERYLLAVGAPTNDLWNLATVQARVGGAATNATGMVSPIQTTAQTGEAAAAQRATAGLPLTQAEIEDARGKSPLMATLMEERNRQYAAQHPEVNTYKINDRGDVPYALLANWEASMKDFRFVMGEATYQRVRREKMIELGLIKPTVKKAS